ncbi:sn-1-specific diacylglycerol lipase ABHD11-like [Anticarsia gemmatalis]|uniref:sn-1-specific diacylglycerol lipase ABHD11-like n=1 Tax=Anticarsia gemmatalis TaxID=129554 RepID=UPI003F76F410
MLLRRTDIIGRYISSTSQNAAIANLAYTTHKYTDPSPKPPILIFHGILENRGQWEHFGKTIVSLTRRTVMIVDLRNHGDSPHMNSHRYIDQATDVLRLMDKLDARQVSLIGYSIGGRTAMCVALMAPQKVAGLLVIDISPISSPPELTNYMPNIMTTMKAVDFSKSSRLSIAKMEARDKLYQSVSNESVMKDLLSNVRRKPNGTIGWICNLDVIIKHYKYWKSFPKIIEGTKYVGPTLFLGGQLSDFIPPDDLTDIRELFPLAVISYINNTGHYIQHEDPTSLLGYTISFIRTHRYHNSTPIIKKQK